MERTQKAGFYVAPAAVQQRVASVFLAKCFKWMAVGLAITGVVAFLTLKTGLVIPLLTTPFLLLALCIAEIGLVFYLSMKIDKLQAGTATALFLGYSALNGLTMSGIFLRYTGTSIAATFFITAGMFTAMAVYGLVTKRDLSSWGSFLIMGVFGILIASIVNIFLNSPLIYWAVTYIGVFVFLGLTAYDTNKIKAMGEQGIMEQGESAIQKGAIMGALALYLDFINLFIMLLRIFGGSDD